MHRVSRAVRYFANSAGLLLLGAVLIARGPAAAHEVRPAYLELSEQEPGRYAVVWKVPAMGDRVLALQPVLPDACRSIAAPQVEVMPGAQLARWSVDCGAGGLTGATIAIDGLRETLTDVVVRMQARDGASQTVVLRPEAPSVTLSEESGSSVAIAAYLRLGIEHILLGVDHLLFVLALMLVVGARWRLLVKTITAFTIAHSITLALATLGLVRVPTAPVEAVIALSIVFVAAEIVHGQQGRSGLTARTPWVVAFTFGLLHGFGFAGALAEIGLPRDAIPSALLLFNAGVEVGQLLFIAAALGLMRFFRSLVTVYRSLITAQPSLISDLRPRWAQFVLAYAIGSMAAFWVVERMLAFT
jgi:hypothetical protein